MSFLSIVEVAAAATLTTSVLWILVSMLEKSESSGFVNALAQGTEDRGWSTPASSIQHFGTPETMTSDLLALAKVLARSGPSQEVETETPEMVLVRTTGFAEKRR